MRLEEQLYTIIDREAGNVIETNLLYEEAVAHVMENEDSDKHDGIYTEDFYEIVVMTKYHSVGKPSYDHSPVSE